MKEELQYAAGYFDAEGSINATVDRAKMHYENIPRVVTCVSIKTSNKESISPFVDISETDKKATKITDQAIDSNEYSNKKQYALELYGEDAVKLLERIIPYLERKDLQARIAIDLLKSKSGRGGDKISYNAAERRLELKEKISELNNIDNKFEEEAAELKD